ncbi:MAG TPA: glycosyltransferase [Longimicrobiaceae bacterium]|nr:glycosyltransferase [Longimicrobiaceae bacterium]
MKVAITADWMSNVGGGGRVLTHLHSMFPDAPVYTTIHDPATLSPEMNGWDIRPSFLQRIPFARKRYQAFLPLMPLAFEQFDLREYDLVLTTNSACAKGVITSPGTLNICYCHTPCRYIWDLYHDYVRDLRFKALAAPVAHWLRVWDRQAADRVDHFVANSHEVSSRIRRHYRRDSEIIYPPVDVDRITPNDREPEDFFLVVSRLVNYKRIDLAIEAANRLKKRLIVIGDGPARRHLRKLAGPTVEFLGNLTDDEVADHYARCRALLFPGFEDFGIAAVEAQAAGRPVIAYGRGGATETVMENATGLHFEEQSVDALCEAMVEFEEHDFDPAVCRRNAERFDAAEFRRRMRETVELQMGGIATKPAVPKPVIPAQAAIQRRQPADAMDVRMRGHD